ncbi:MAG: hypothetical protein D4R70_06725 [Betaproteobacteria bacterium]|nr:MAG: hypothetical protein D4R70_06725 [Betaproteobacteria bacterium]
MDHPVTLPVARFDAVKTAADLPDRLFMGRLEADSFRLEKKGWRADWRSPDGLTRFRHAGHLSSLELQWMGEEAVTLVTAEAFSELAQTVQNIHPEAWMRRLAERLEAQWNVRVFPHREEDAVVSAFPDGYQLTLLLPVAADRLMALFDLHQAWATEQVFALEAHLRLHFSVVNYIEGRNPPMLAHPAGLVMHHVNALGTPAAEAPEKESDPDGEVAWTLRRSHYLYTAHIALVDAPVVIERLAAAGFIGAAGDALEMGAALMPLGYEYAAQNAWWFDTARARRIFYPTLGDSEDRNALASNSSAIWNKALIRDAQKAAEQCKADTARAVMEGLSRPDPGAALH